MSQRLTRKGSANALPAESVSERRHSIGLSKDDVSNREILESVKSLTSEIQQLQTCVKSLETRVLKIENSITFLRESQQRADTEIKNIKVAINDLRSSKGNLMKEILDEVEQREQRRDNVMIFGLPERVDGSLEQRKQHDKNALANLFSELDLSMTASDIQRVGRMSSGNARPVRVRLADRSLKPQLLRQSKNLRKSSMFKQVYIHCDLTKVQQHERLQLRKELKERRAAGEDVVIYKDKVCPRDSLKNFLN